MFLIYSIIIQAFINVLIYSLKRLGKMSGKICFFLGEPSLELQLSGISLPKAGGWAAEAPSPSL